MRQRTSAFGSPESVFRDRFACTLRNAVKIRVSRGMEPGPDAEPGSDRSCPHVSVLFCFIIAYALPIGKNCAEKTDKSEMSSFLKAISFRCFEMSSEGLFRVRLFSGRGVF